MVRGLSPHGRGTVKRQGWVAREVGLSRTGGGTIEAVRRGSVMSGLSPHGRGNREHGLDVRPQDGSIPARAGEPSSRALAPLTARVYPRTGGGTTIAEAGVYLFEGLSPHGRGNRIRLGVVEEHRGSIPARAGEPAPGLSPRGPGRVYPRTGGGTSTKQQTDNAQLLKNKCRVCVLTGS